MCEREIPSFRQKSGRERGKHLSPGSCLSACFPSLSPACQSWHRENGVQLVLRTYYAGNDIVNRKRISPLTLLILFHSIPCAIPHQLQQHLFLLLPAAGLWAASFDSACFSFTFADLILLLLLLLLLVQRISTRSVSLPHCAAVSLSPFPGNDTNEETDVRERDVIVIMAIQGGGGRGKGARESVSGAGCCCCC